MSQQTQHVCPRAPGRVTRTLYLREEGTLKTQVHDESKESIYNLSEQVHLLLTLVLETKQDHQPSRCFAAFRGHLFP